MRLFIYLLLIGLGQTLSGQVAIQRPLSDTLKRSADRTDQTWIGIEATGGLNLPIGRVPARSFETYDRLLSRPGLVAGLNLVFPPDYDVAVVLGADYILERGALTDYGRENNRSALVSQQGDLHFTEHFLRLRLEVRAKAGRFLIVPGGQITRFLSSRFQYDYTQTRTGFTDLETNTRVELEEPILSRGRVDRRFERGGYVGLTLALAYELRQGTHVQLHADLGLQLYSQTVFNDLHRQARTRLQVGVLHQLLVR